MVHALHEAWRVLKPGSSVVDLRPRSQHCRVGFLDDGRLTAVGTTQESLENYRAARAALAEAQKQNLFRQRYTSRFSLIMAFPSLEELRDWLYDLDDTVPKESSDQLVRHIGEAGKVRQSPPKIVAIVPFVLRVLEKNLA